MAVDNSVSVILFGGGYTLQKVAERLPLGSFAITSRRADQRALWRDTYHWNSEVANIESLDSLKALFYRYPHARVLVDSVPPLRSGDPSAGVEKMLQALSGTGIERIIYLSTTGVFGGRDGQVVDEETPPAPWNEQGSARFLCEKLYRAASERGLRARATALRIPAIYGPDRGLLSSLRSGTYRMVDDGNLWTNRIHVDDLAEVIIRSIHAASLPEVLCVSDDEPALSKEVVSYLCQTHGLPLPGSISSQECVAHGAYTMVSNQRVSNKRVKDLLGIELRYPSYREGMALGK
jgi:hypothetical protein